MNPPKNRENTITRYRLTEEHLVGGAGPELRPAVHRHALSGRAGRRKLRRCAADAGCAAFERDQRGGEAQDSARRLRYSNDTDHGKRGVGYVQFE